MSIPFYDLLDALQNFIDNLKRPTADAHGANKRYVDDYTQHDRRKLFNPDFRIPDPADATKFLGWTISGTGAITRDTSKLVYGSYSAKFVCSTGQTATLTSDLVDVFNLNTSQLQSLYDALGQILYNTASVAGLLEVFIDWFIPGGGSNGTFAVGSKNFTTSDPKIGAIFNRTDPPTGTAQAALRIKLTGSIAGSCTVNVAGCKLEEALSSASIGALDIKQSPIQMTDDTGVTKYGHAWDDVALTVKQFGAVQLETGAKIVGGGGDAIFDADEGYVADLNAVSYYKVRSAAGAVLGGLTARRAAGFDYVYLFAEPGVRVAIATDNTLALGGDYTSVTAFNDAGIVAGGEAAIEGDTARVQAQNDVNILSVVGQVKIQGSPYVAEWGVLTGVLGGVPSVLFDSNNDVIMTRRYA